MPSAVRTQLQGCANGRAPALAAFGEEGLKDGGALDGQDARGDFHLMVEARVGKDFKAGADGATLRIVGAVDQARDTRLDDGARAHAARLDGDVKRGAGETIVAEKAGGLAKRDDFGVGGGIIVANRAIARTDEDFTVVDEHGANGNLASGGGRTGFRKRFLHELKVSFHVWRENNMREEQKKLKRGDAESTAKKEPQVVGHFEF